MEIPKTTIENPYIEFKFDKKGNLFLSITNDWWGGKEYSFKSSNGYEGNTCPPEELETYIKAFKSRKIRLIEKEIKVLESKLKKLKMYANESNI
jgi:hypothetical protein